MLVKIYKVLILPFMVLFFSGFFYGDGDIYYQVSKSIDVFGKIYKEVTFNYVDQINPEEFMVSGINGMLASLDPYTVYIDEKRQGDIDLLTTGKYGGIGVSIGLRNDKVTIVDLIEGYSAQRQGLRIGDVITKVDDIDINKNNFDKISSYVKGEPRTEVKITILRDGDQKIVFKLVREEIRIKNLLYSGFYPESSNNVYLKLVSFTRTAGDEVNKAILDLKEKKDVNSIVLDLRGNPGGLLDAAVDVCERFLKKNQLVVSVMGRDSSSYKKYLSTEEPIAGTIKLVVLVDSGSASASEIVAGAIQDHDRGVLVGTNTFGKGLVQTVVPLSLNSSLKITTARYYTPSGRCIQKIDYAKSNKVLVDDTISSAKDYTTDNKRMVYGSGGIIPDSIVEEGEEPELLSELISRGMIFRYATDYSSKTSEDKFLKDSNDNLYNSFMEYLNKEKFEYKSEADKQVDDLIKTSKKESYNKKIIDELNALKNNLADMGKFEFENHKNEIISALRDELFSRYEGQAGRIKNTLKMDRQFEVALDILKNDNLYNHLLSRN